MLYLRGRGWRGWARARMEAGEVHMAMAGGALHITQGSFVARVTVLSRMRSYPGEGQEQVECPEDSVHGCCAYIIATLPLPVQTL